MSEIPDGLLNSVIAGDCMDLMRGLPSQSVDLIVTDPPFSINFGARRSNYNRDGSLVLDDYHEAPSDYLSFSEDWMALAARSLKTTGSMYVFSGWNHLSSVLQAIDACGLQTVNHLIWKFQFGLTTTRRYVTSHYHCLFVCKDDAKRKFRPYARFDKEARTSDGGSAHYRDKEDVWTIPREYWRGEEKTPNKLPSEIIRKMLAYSSDPGDVVLDPFSGSGQVAVVAKEMGRNFVGFEISEEFVAFANRRLNGG